MRKFTIVKILLAGLTAAALGAVTGYFCFKAFSPADNAILNPPEIAEIQTETPPNMPTETQAQSPTRAQRPDPRPQYLLSMHEGFVAVFYASDTHYARIKEVTGTPVNALSSEEEQRLATGINIFDDEQLAKILQDYDS